jgi:exopolyphosphatase/guanosine-5'-triphosphate,3'-diphosphate pyrophosphatase
VQSLARRCGVAERHSRQVGKLALELFDQTVELHGLGPDDRELLEYGAMLHTIGQHVSSDGHHKHAAYLIRHGQLRGFSPAEVDLLAAMARWHRKGEPKAIDDLYGELSRDDEDRLRKLTALFRVADALDRSHHDVVRGVHAQVGPSLVLLRLDTDGDVELEQWAARRRRDLFEKAFDRELEVTAHPAGRARGRVSPADL